MDIYIYIYIYELLLLQNAEVVAQLGNLFLSKVPARRIAALLKQKLCYRCFLCFFQILKNI